MTVVAGFRDAPGTPRLPHRAQAGFCCSQGGVPVESAISRACLPVVLEPGGLRSETGQDIDQLASSGRRLGIPMNLQRSPALALALVVSLGVWPGPAGAQQALRFDPPPPKDLVVPEFADREVDGLHRGARLRARRPATGTVAGRSRLHAVVVCQAPAGRTADRFARGVGPRAPPGARTRKRRLPRTDRAGQFHGTGTHRRQDGARSGRRRTCRATRSG